MLAHHARHGPCMLHWIVCRTAIPATMAPLQSSERECLRSQGPQPPMQQPEHNHLLSMWHDDRFHAVLSLTECKCMGHGSTYPRRRSSVSAMISQTHISTPCDFCANVHKHVAVQSAFQQLNTHDSVRTSMPTLSGPLVPPLLHANILPSGTRPLHHFTANTLPH